MIVWDCGLKQQEIQKERISKLRSTLMNTSPHIPQQGLNPCLGLLKPQASGLSLELSPTPIKPSLFGSICGKLTDKFRQTPCSTILLALPMRPPVKALHKTPNAMKISLLLNPVRLQPTFATASAASTKLKSRNNLLITTNVGDLLSFTARKVAAPRTHARSFASG